MTPIRLSIKTPARIATDYPRFGAPASTFIFQCNRGDPPLSVRFVTSFRDADRWRILLAQFQLPR